MRKAFSGIAALDFRRAGIWFGFGSICLACLVNVSPAGTGDTSSSSAKIELASSGQQLQREGTKVNQVTGYFRQASGRIIFVPKENSKSNYVCIENLMLQRIAEGLTGQTEFGAWIVSGELTEYRNANYMIVKTAQQVE